MEKQQTCWGALPAWYFFLAAMGAMMMVLAVLADFGGFAGAGKSNGVAGLMACVLSGAGSLLLMSELTHKERAMLVNARPFSVVMSFGSLVQCFYIPLVFLYAACFFPIAPWYGMAGVKTVLAVFVVVLALLYTAYPAIELGEAKGRSFWNGGGLLALFLISGLVTGAAALLLLLVAIGESESIYAFYAQKSGMICLAMQLLFIPGYVLGMKHAPAAEARRGALLLWNGGQSKAFWGGIVLLGTALPFLLYMAGAPVLAALLSLYGGILFRLHFLRAGVRLALPGEEREELSRSEIAALAQTLEARWQEKAHWLYPGE